MKAILTTPPASLENTKTGTMRENKQWKYNNRDRADERIKGKSKLSDRLN